MTEYYENGPEGMPRVERMTRSTIMAVLSQKDVPTIYVSREEDYNSLCKFAHAVAEETLARVPAWPVERTTAPAIAPDGESWRHKCEETERALIYWKAKTRALLAAAPAPIQQASPVPLFDRKLADLQQRGYEVIGRILHKNGEYALFDSSCRWLTKPQYQRLMHEQDGSLFATPPALAGSQVQAAGDVRDAALEDAAKAIEGEICECCLSEDEQAFAEHAANTIRNLKSKPNTDCSGEPANCPDNEGYGCACDPMNKAAMREQP